MRPADLAHACSLPYHQNRRLGSSCRRKKPSKPQVAESPIADVFENRRPSAEEKNWAEEDTLAPTLERAPERPIGAPTGVNLDEQGHARFTTISAVPVRRLYTQARPAGRTGSRRNIWDIPERRLSLAAFTRRDIGASFTPCGSSPDSHRRKRNESALQISA